MRPARVGLSVRTRLTLWNVSVLALVLIVLGGTLRCLVRVSLIKGVDREMGARAHRFTSGWPGFRHERPYPEPPGRGNDPYRPRIFSRLGTPLMAFETKLKPWDQSAIGNVFARGEAFFSTVRVDEETIRIGTFPLRDRQGKVEGALQSPFRLTEIERGLTALDTTLLTLFPLALVVAGGGGAFLTERALRPVRRITQAADRIEAQNLSGRLPVSGRDEFSDLATRFNRMLERLETAFERQRRFTADASHELRTPLCIIKASTSLALDDEDHSADGCRRTLHSIDGAANRMGRIVQDLLFLARSDADQLPFSPVPISAEGLLKSLLDDLPEPTSEEARVTLDAFDPALFLRGDMHQLKRAFGNLLENALRHTPRSGRVTLSAVPDDSGKWVVITVRDTGEGIAPEHLPYIFERFYRIDEARLRPRGGTGLGLAIVKTIIEAHDGTIRLESMPGKGTAAVVTLPAI